MGGPAKAAGRSRAARVASAPRLHERHASLPVGSVERSCGKERVTRNGGKKAVPMALHDRGKEEVRAKMGHRKGSDAVGVRNCGGTYRQWRTQWVGLVCLGIPKVWAHQVKKNSSQFLNSKPKPTRGQQATEARFSPSRCPLAHARRPGRGETRDGATHGRRRLRLAPWPPARYSGVPPRCCLLR